MKAQEKPWYKKWWGIILAVLILPFFLIWYAWSQSDWSKNTKIFSTTGASMFILLAAATSNSNPSTQTSLQPIESTNPTAKSIAESAPSPSATPAKSVTASASPKPESTSPAAQTASAPAASAPQTSSSGVVKMSSTQICHAPGTTYYEKTKNYTGFSTLDACLAAGGRLPKK